MHAAVGLVTVACERVWEVGFHNVREGVEIVDQAKCEYGRTKCRHERSPNSIDEVQDMHQLWLQGNRYRANQSSEETLLDSLESSP